MNHRRWIKPLSLSLIVVLVCLIVQSGCNTAKPVPRAGETVQPVVGGLDENDFRRIWMNILPLEGADKLSRIFVEQDILLACTPDNVVYTVDNSDGVLKYFRYVNGGGRQVGKPVVTGNYIVFPGQANLEVYKRSDGNLAKSIPLSFSISSDAIAVGDEVCLGVDTGGGELAQINVDVALRPDRWNVLAGGAVTGAPAYYDGLLFFGSGDGGLRAVNYDDRDGAWLLHHDAYETTGPIKGDVKADASGVYASSLSGRLVCVDRQTGQLKWQYFAPHALETGPVVTKTTVYQLVPTLGLVALDKSKPIAVDPSGRGKVEEVNRTQRWNCPDAVQFVAEDEGLVYVKTAAGELWALDRDTGQVRYRGTHSHFASIATNISDNTIYAATADGVVYAIKPVLRPGSPGYLD